MLTLKIKDPRSLKLIYNLEAMDLIQVISREVPKPTKLSALLKGCISTEQAERLHAEIEQMRKV